MHSLCASVSSPSTDDSSGKLPLCSMHSLQLNDFSPGCGAKLPFSPERVIMSSLRVTVTLLETTSEAPSFKASIWKKETDVTNNGLGIDTHTHTALMVHCTM